jgi:hypothetical protein
MSQRRRFLATLCLAGLLLLAACANAGGSLDEEQAADLAWEALAPHTSSKDRDQWQTIEVRRVEGREVADEFEGRAAPGCFGPEVPDNEPIRAGSSYWYVQFKPLPATPLARPTLSPTAPPFIPEPFVREAHFLLDDEGRIVARSLQCVIY